MERAKLMFGCYRRGDANDPEIYVAACTSVLARYPAEIVRNVTDPYSGLPARKTEQGWSGLPDVADVKEACEAEATRQKRLREYAALPKPTFKRLAGPSLPPAPGSRATLFVHADHKGYDEMREKAKTADRAEWKDDELGRPGIWVAYGWYDDYRSGKLKLKRIKAPAFTPPAPEWPADPPPAEHEQAEIPF